MNGVVVLLVCAAVLAVGYLGYGRWLANKWGIDKNALTPAKRMEDGQAFVPATTFTAFAHQFSSICGAGPVTGTIVAMAFGWVPVVLWVLVGGIFFGAVHDFGSLYASMKNNGKSLAQLIDKYIGKTGRRLFLLFSWLFCCIVIAAFTDMVAGTFKMADGAAAGMGIGVDADNASYLGGAAATISILFTFVAIAFGQIRKKFNLSGAAEFALAVVLIVAMFAVGMQFPVYLGKYQWFFVLMIYLVFVGALPVDVLKTPRDYLTAIMMIVMIVCGVLGIFVLGAKGEATMTAPMFNGFTTTSGFIFPVLFVSVACGALSGFHSLVSTSTTSKQVSNEQDSVVAGYGAMIAESFVGIIVIVIAAIVFSEYNNLGTGSLNVDGAAATPFQIFSYGVAKGMMAFGIDGTIARVFMTMNVSALALTSLDAVARIARTSFSEFFSATNDALSINDRTGLMKVVGNPYFAVVVTLIPGFALAYGGYANIWPLFGASNQLLGGMTMIMLAVFCKCTGRKGFMLYVPVCFLLVCTFTSLFQSIMGCVTAVQAYGFFGTIPATATTAAVSVAATKGLQLIVAILLVVLGLIVAVNCLKEFFTKEEGSIPDEEPEWTDQGRADFGSQA